MGCLVIAGAALFSFACGDDEPSEEEKNEVIAAWETITMTTDPEVGATLVTEDFYQNAFAGLLSGPEELFSEDAEFPALSEYDVEIDGDTAVLGAIETAVDPVGQKAYVELEFVREGDAWIADDYRIVEGDGPDGASEVSIGLVDFAFEVEPEDFESGQPLSITATNSGEQPHIIDMFFLPEGVTVDDIIASEEGPPEGVETIIAQGIWAPGDTGTVFTENDLAPGNYAIICFLPDVTDFENEPHFAQGMVAEFTVE